MAIAAAALSSCQKDEVYPTVARVIYRVWAPEGGTACALINGSIVTEQIDSDGYAQFGGNLKTGDAISLNAESPGDITVEVIVGREQYLVETATKSITINRIWQ